MTCQEIAQPGPDGFRVTGIADIIPLMPHGTCQASSILLANKHPDLHYQEGVLVMLVDGEVKASVRHAWNIGPGGEVIDSTRRRPPADEDQDITYAYVPDGPEHDEERQAIAALIGEPEGLFRDADAQEEDDRRAAEWLDH